jgi:hypothetical protein
MYFLFRLGVPPSQLPAFNKTNVDKVPNSSGVYIIYEPAGPFYVGCSGRDIQRRLLAHLNGTGNANVKLALKIRGGAPTLTFTYALIPHANHREVESVLIAGLGVTKLANMRHEGMYVRRLLDARITGSRYTRSIRSGRPIFRLTSGKTQIL